MESVFLSWGWLLFIIFTIMVIKELRSIIQTVSKELGTIIPSESYEVILREKPHNPCSLPSGKMAVYMFRYNDQFLKIGKVGPKIMQDFKINTITQIQPKVTLQNQL